MLKYLQPIITDNRNFRKDIPDVNKHFELAKIEMQQFPTVNGVISEDSLVEIVDCPVCLAATHRQLFVKWGIMYSQCLCCTHVFARNRLKHHILAEAYKESETDKLDRAVQRSPQHREYWGEIYARYLALLGIDRESQATLLDVGSGAGVFLDYCRINTKLKTSACELAEDSYDDLLSIVGKDNLFFGKTIEDTEFNERKFDYITLWGVLEHIASPNPVIEKCARLLTDDGKILIFIPNLFSHAFRILGIDTPTLNPRAHINFYTPKSIAQLCARHNLAIAWQSQELPVIDLTHPHVQFNQDLIHEIVQNNECYYHVYALTSKDSLSSINV